jgi:predicted RNase H-like nuclease (RuvC/YqgF family)
MLAATLTTYRDDLAAAQARVAMLEAELEALRTGKPSATPRGGQRLDSGTQSPVPRVRARVEGLRQKLEAAEDRISELERALEASREALLVEQTARREAEAAPDPQRGA